MKVNIELLKEHRMNREIYGDDDSEEQFQELVTRIKESGWIDPIIVNKEWKILSGHRRYRAAKLLGYTAIDCEKVSISPDDELEILLSSNVYREKTIVQKVKEAKYYHEIESRKAHERQLSGTTLSPTGDQGRTDEIVAEKVGMSRTSLNRAMETVDNGEKIAEEGLRHLIDDTLNIDISAANKLSKQPIDVIKQVSELVNGDVSQVGKVLRNLTNLEIKKTIPLPPGKYSVIYTEYNNSEDYDRFTKINLGDLAEVNSVLFLWTLPLLLDQAMKLIQIWGFHYKTAFFWNKDIMNECSDFGEIMLIGTRGDPPMLSLSKENRPETTKPAIVTEMIEKGYPQVDKVKIRLGDGWEIF